MNTNPSENQNRPKALVIGATGSIGGEVAHALIAAGWHVTGLVRDPQNAASRAGWVGGVEWIAGDAMLEADVVAAARSAKIVFHGASPPGYKNWRGLAIPMLRHSIAAAHAASARLIFPGNVYNFGPDAGAVVTEISPQIPLTRKGRIRVEMEAMLEEAARNGSRVLIIRAGDFFGPHQPSSWFKDVMVKPGRELKSVTYPGKHEVGHAWAYLPDLAATVARLAVIEDCMPAFERFNFGGHWLPRGVQMATAIAQAAGNPNAPIRNLPWALIFAGAPFSTFMREVLEMRYLWQVPLRLDNTKLYAMLGTEPQTPLDVAVTNTLSALGIITQR